MVLYLMVPGLVLSLTLEQVRQRVSQAASDPQAVSEVYEAGKAALRGNEPQQAAAIFALYTASFVQPPQEAQAYQLQGLAYSQMARFSEAIQALQKSLLLEPFEAKPILEDFRLFELARAQSGLKDDWQAMRTLDTLLATPLDDSARATACLLRASCQANVDRVGAVGSYLDVATNFPLRAESAYAYYQAGALLYRALPVAATSADLADIWGYFVAATRSSVPELRASAYLGVGMVHLRGNDAEAALAAFQKAVQGGGATPMDAPAKLLQAEALLALGRTEEAITLVNGIYADASQSPRWIELAQFWLGRQAFKRGDWVTVERILTDYTNPVKVFVDSNQHCGLYEIETALLMLAQAHYYQGHYQTAIEYSILCTQGPLAQDLRPLARFTQAEALCGLLQFDAAIMLFDEVVQGVTNPTLCRQAYGRKGDCLFVLAEETPNRAEEALNAYQRASSMNVSEAYDANFEYAHKIGRCYEKMGRFDRALTHYYQFVILPYECQTVRPNRTHPTCLWYVRTLFRAAHLLQYRDDNVAAASLLEKIILQRLPGAAEAARRIQRLTKRVQPTQSTLSIERL